MYLSSLENNDHNKKLNNNSFSPNNIEFSLDIIKNVFFDNTNIYFLEEFPQDYFLKKSKKIYYFKIVKNKKRGKRRLKNNSKLHDKNSQYNIICKIKVYFTKSLLEHANKLYNKNLEEDKINNKQYLLPINEKDKNLNINWFYRTAKEYLSSKISGKYNAHNKDYNKNQIDLIYAENENKDLIQFLEQNICTIYKEYISDEKSQIGIFKGFRKINDDLKYLKSKFNYDDDYIKEVKRISLNLEQIYKEKKNKNDKIK
jgi:hypothetical protein